MKNRRLLLFFLVTLAVIIAAGVASQWRAPQSSVEKVKLFPELSQQINTVSRITVNSDEKSVELIKSGNDWLVATAANYPAIFNKVRGVALNLSQLQIVDHKTDNPALYSRLAVEDPLQDDAKSLLLKLYDDRDQVLASVIVGNPRQSSSSKPGLYVRLPDAKTALLVEGRLDISAENTDWYIRELIDIPAAIIKRVDITYADGSTFGIFKDNRDQPDFTSTDEKLNRMSAAKILINRTATGLEELRADAVMAAEDFSFPDETITTTFTTFDGIITTLKIAQLDGLPYARFTFSIDEELAAVADAAAAASELAKTEEIPTVNAVVDNLSARLQGWVYQIPDFKYQALTTNPDSLRKPAARP